MAITAQTRTELVQLVVSMLGEAPSTEMLTDLVTKANAGSTVQELADSLATNAAFTSQFPIWMTATEFTSKVVASMFAGSSVAQADTDAAVDYIAGMITAGTFTKTSAVVALTSYLASADGVANATYGSAAQSYQNKVEVAEYYTITKGQGGASAAERKAAIANVTDAADAVATEKASVDAGAEAAAAAEIAAQSKSEVFTTGVDNLLGSVGDDTFNGAVNQANGTGSTAQPGDIVTGGAGTDTLNIAVAGDAGGAHTIQAITTTGVENLLLSNYDINAAETTVDTSLMTGLANIGVQSTGSAGNTTFSGMTSIVDATMKNGSSNLTMTYAAGTSGAADTQNVAIGGLTAGTFTANGLETIALTGSLSASKMTNVTGTGTTKISIAGDQNFTMTTASTIKGIDASANTGKTSLILGAATHTVTLGAGADTLDVGATMTAADKLQGGDGIDTIKMSVGNNTVNGGATSPLTSEFVQSGGFEIIEVASTNNAATLALKDIPGVTNVEAEANTKLVQFTGLTNNTTAETVAFTINGVAAATASVDFTETNAATETADLGTKFAAAVTAMAGLTASHDGTGGVTVTNTSGTTDRLDISITAGSANTFTEVTGDYNTLTVTGITDQAVDIYTAGAVTARLVDSSGASDSLSVNLKSGLGDRAAAQTVATLDIADTIETLNLSSTGMKAGIQKTLTTLTADNSLTALNITGSDKLTIGTLTAAKLATIDASAYTGDLSIPGVTSALTQTITTGSGNDTIILAGGLAATDVIDAGGNTALVTGAAGSDTVTLTGNVGSIIAATAPNISNAEVIQQAVGGAFASYIDGSKLTNIGEYAFSGTSGPLTITNAPAGMEIGLGLAAVEAAGTLTYSLADATGTADALTLDYGDAIDQGVSNTIVTSGIETLNVKATKDSGGANTTQTLVLTNAGVATINVTDGDAGSTLALGTLNKATTSVLAGGNKGIVTATAAATSPGMTVTAPAAVAHTMTLSAKADNVTLTGLLGTTNQAIAAGASATGTVDTFTGTMTAANTNLTSLTGFETLNLTVPAATAVGLDDAGEDGALQTARTVNVTGGNSNSSFTIGGASNAAFDDGRGATTTLNLDMSGFGGTTDVLFASDGLDAYVTVTGSAQADHVRTVVAAAAGATGNNPTVSGVEQMTITTATADVDGSMSFAKVTGLTRLNASFVAAGAAGETIAFTGLGAGVPVYVASTHTADSLSATLASATGAADALSVVMLGNTGTFDLNSAGIETLTITGAGAGGTIDIGGVTATTGSASTVNLSGASAITLNNVHTSVGTINAAALSGGLTLGSGQRDADALTVTGGPSSDAIAMENVADVLDGGNNPTATTSIGDTLEIVTAAILGGITVDLTAADQVTTMDGGANAAVQQGFEHVDLRGFTNFGAVVTGDAGVNVITGTASADRINAGKGNDLIQIATTGAGNTDQINGGAGADTVSVLAGTYTPGADSSLVGVETVVSAVTATIDLTTQTESMTIDGTGANVQTITGGSAADTINVSGGGNDIVKVDAGQSDFGAITGSNKIIDVTAADVINVAAGDVLNLAGSLDTEGNYDNLDETAAGGNISATITTAEVAQFVGVYEASTNSFTSSATNAAGTASTTDVDANLYLYAIADGTDTTATEGLVVTGVGAQADSAITNGVITFA